MGGEYLGFPGNTAPAAAAAGSISPKYMQINSIIGGYKNRWLLVYQHLVGLGLIGQKMSRYFDVLLFFSNIYGDKDLVSNKGYSKNIVVIVL